MTKQQLLQGLARIESLASVGKLQRLARLRSRYLLAIFYKNFLYRLRRKPIARDALLFTGQSMHVALPAATDIFLTGGKSHDSEVRMARFLIQNLGHDSVFLDVGAHFGYFSLVAHAVAGGGQVHAFEPAPETFQTLARNLRNQPNIFAHHCAVTKEKGTVHIHQFDNLHSEYNSLYIDQYQAADWAHSSAHQAFQVDGITLDDFCATRNLAPDIIKIDVEGAEHDVLAGAARLLSSDKKPVILMEYLHPNRGNASHRQANGMLQAAGYGSYVIARDGSVSEVQDIDAYLVESNAISDNIAYIAR